MEDLERLKRRLERAKSARKSAESIAEQKTRQLYQANQNLTQLADDLEHGKAALQETLGYLTAILDNMADGLLVLDPNGRIKMVNTALLQMLGREGEDLVNRMSAEVLESDLLESARRVTSSEYNVQVELPLADDRVGMAAVSPILSEGSGEANVDLGFVILVRDITVAKEIDRMKTDFISNVSHELRTPLTSILGFTKIIRRKFDKALAPNINTDDNPKAAKAVKQVRGNIDIIIEEGERLTNLINDVLDVAKMEAGQLNWNMESLQIVDLIDRVAASTSSLFMERDVEFRTEVESNLPALTGDKDRLIQVLINLISNAAKFTEKGTVTCRVRRDGGQVVVSVTDTGMGIATDELDKVFEKFKQAGDTLTDKPKGTGLGLPISKQIVEHHGGVIWAESRLGEGSTFSFRLPLDVEKPASPMTTSIELQKLLHQFRGQENEGEAKLDALGKTVLVVDDEPNIREYLRQELETAGYHVEEAENGLNAIEKAKEHRPHLIILDVMMPTMNGFDAAAVLKNDPSTMDIPIMIHSIVEDRERGYLIGIDRYLTKPIETSVLLQEVNNLLVQEGVGKTILVVDEDQQATQKLTQLLEGAGDNKVEVARRDTCLEKALSLRPDMIIVDVSVPDSQELLQSLRSEKALAHTAFLLLAANQDTPISLESTSSG
ncbi:MAG: response regulator [Deltaproteobacteria bacterium]|nr:MAG: response regulator [Deltaproteobacteria bacterium]